MLPDSLEVRHKTMNGDEDGGSFDGVQLRSYF